MRHFGFSAVRLHLHQVMVLAGVLLMFLGPLRGAQAGIWAEPGDVQLRSDIELLSAYGIIDNLTMMWPIPWRGIARNIEGKAPQDYPPYIAQSLRRVQARMPQQGDVSRIRFNVQASASTGATLVRDFESAARDDIDTSASIEYMGEGIYGKFEIGYQGDGSDGDHVFDGSYGAFVLKDVIFYGGFVDQWWGPGWQSSLILSNNARPVPKVGITRLTPRPFGTKWLSWLGPWQFNLFVGFLEEDRVVSNPLLIGTRLDINPLPGLAIGFSRLLQMCGEGRPCSFDTFTNAFLAFGDRDNPMGLDALDVDPSNQLAGFDVQYTTLLSERYTLNLYFQIMGNDEKHGIPANYAGIAGASLAGAYSDEGAHWRLNFEIEDSAEGIFGGRQFNSFYNHSVFRTGLRFEGRSLGGSLDGDSLLYSFAGRFTDSRNRGFRLSYHYAEINRNGEGIQFVSQTAETVNLIKAGASFPTQYGLFDVEVRFQDDQPNTPGTNDSDAQIELRWRTGF